MKAFVISLFSAAILSLPVISNANIANISVYPGAINFGTVKVGSFSTMQTIGIVNSGQKAFQLSFSNNCFGGEIDVRNYCSSFLYAGSTCNLQVVFAPRSAGMKNCSVSVMAYGGGGGRSISIYGTAK